MSEYVYFSSESPFSIGTSPVPPFPPFAPLHRCGSDPFFLPILFFFFFFFHRHRPPRRAASVPHGHHRPHTRYGLHVHLPRGPPYHDHPAPDRNRHGHTSHLHRVGHIAYRHRGRYRFPTPSPPPPRLAHPLRRRRDVGRPVSRPFHFGPTVSVLCGPRPPHGRRWGKGAPHPGPHTERGQTARGLDRGALSRRRPRGAHGKS